MDTANILIAEDDAVLREVYVKKFTLSGFSIETVKNGEEAVAAIAAKAPDIMILDINMPILDGFGVLAKYPKTARTFPIIILSNFGDDKTKQKAIEMGADDFFVKSEMTIRTLLEMVQSLLKAKKYWAK